MKPLLTQFKRSLIFALTLLGGISLSTPGYSDTQSDQRKVQRKIDQLSAQIIKQRKESNYLNSQVTRLEKELGTLTKQQHDTEQKIKKTQLRIADTDKRKTELSIELKDQHAALAQQLQAMHTAGEQSHLRLLLMQDNPSDISRNIEYFNYLNHYRADKITKLNNTTAELEAVTETAKKERIELKKLQEKLAEQQQAVRKKLDSRAQALQKVRSDLNSKQRRMNKLKRQEEALQREIDRLARAAEQRHREAQQRRQQAEARKRAQEQRKKQTATNNTASRQPTPAPARPVARTPNKPFHKLRGQLAWPVQGKVVHSYYSRRNERQRWKGIVIAAPGGSKVRAVAAGTVAYAGWMNGYGHLIIVEHDRNYMSLYGYNRAVFKRAGQRVGANEVIAAVGNSGGRNQNALYFEIRRKTVPQNPGRWLR